MTRAERCTPTCMSVLQVTFECLTLSLYFIRDSSSPALSPSARIFASRVRNRWIHDARGACTEHRENETSNLQRPVGSCPSLCRSSCLGTEPAATTQWRGHMVRIPGETIQSAQFRLRGLA